MTVTPAYGRDYRSKANILTDWLDGKDFVIADVSSPDCGRYINRDDAETGGIRSVQIRYDRLRKVAVVNRSGDTWR